MIGGNLELEVCGNSRRPAVLEVSGQALQVVRGDTNRSGKRFFPLGTKRVFLRLRLENLQTIGSEDDERVEFVRTNYCEQREPLIYLRTREVRSDDLIRGLGKCAMV